MQYAIIQLAGKQFKVRQGETLVTDSQAADDGQEIKVSDVLLIGDDEANTVSVGTPLVQGAIVILKHVNHSKGEKIRVAKYKSKSRYRRVRGHRQHLSNLEVVSISA